MVAVIREVVVLPLLPVITIFLALLAPITDLSTLGSIRRATMPGKLVPPLTRSKRPVPPTSFPAEIASVKRARPRPDGALNLPLLCCISSFTIKYLYLFVCDCPCVCAACSIAKCRRGDKPWRTGPDVWREGFPSADWRGVRAVILVSRSPERSEGAAKDLSTRRARPFATLRVTA